MLGCAAHELIPEALAEAAKQGDLETRIAVRVVVAAPDSGADMRDDRGRRVATLERARIEIYGRCLLAPLLRLS